MAGVLAELVAQVQVITDRDVHELPLLTYGEAGVRLELLNYGIFRPASMGSGIWSYVAQR